MALRWPEEEAPPAVGYPTEPGTIWDRTLGLDPFGYDGHSRWPLQRLRGLGIPGFQSAHVWKPPSCKRLVRVLSAMFEVRFQHQLVVSLALFLIVPLVGSCFHTLLFFTPRTYFARVACRLPGSPGVAGPRLRAQGGRAPKRGGDPTAFAPDPRPQVPSQARKRSERSGGAVWMAKIHGQNGGGPCCSPPSILCRKVLPPTIFCRKVLHPLTIFFRTWSLNPTHHTRRMFDNLNRHFLLACVQKVSQPEVLWDIGGPNFCDTN